MAQGQDTGKAPENQGAGDGAPETFGDAFDQLTAPAAEGTGGENGATGAATPPGGETGSTGPAGGLPDPSTVGADGSVPGPTGAAAPAAEAGATGAAAPGATGTDASPAGATGPASTSDQFLAELARVMAAGNQPATKQEADARPPAVTPWSPEQTALVGRAREEYPEVFEAFDLEMKKAAQIITDHVFTTLAPTIRELQGSVTSTANLTYEQQLLQAVPDYQELRPKVAAWIDTLPNWQKTAAQAVAENGTLNDVVDLVEQYRKAHGVTPPAANGNADAPADNGAGAAAAAASAAANAAAAAAKRRATAQSLAPVDSKRPGVAGDVIAADDFGGAFDTFAKDMLQQRA